MLADVCFSFFFNFGLKSLFLFMFFMVKFLIMDLNKFNAVFSPIGFVIESSSEVEIVSFVNGKDFGVYLTVRSDVFSVDLVYHHTNSFLFKWQHYVSFSQLYGLLLDNHILSEQLFEKFGLSVHT
jgi:hypothetical protein